MGRSTDRRVRGEGILWYNVPEITAKESTMDASRTGELIAARRRELGLSQEELAERLHVTDKAVSKWENVPYALQRINDVMNRNQLCVVPPKSSETEQKSPVSLHIIFGFSQARTATQSTPYPVPNEMPLEDQDELSLSPKQLAWPRYLLWRRPQW